LPDRIKATTVGNPVAYTRELEQVYRDAFSMWVRHVAPETVVDGEPVA